MPLRASLRSFHERRIVVPVARDGLVLDVGSGDKPSWRADVLLDAYPGDEHASQRSGSEAARVSRPLFLADAADMPFADHAFDYVICSHLLEHVADPAGVIAELARVARAGYIEVPRAASSKIIDFPSHLWWCSLDESGPQPVLVLTAKTQLAFDRDIHDYLTSTGLDRRVQALLDSHFHHNYLAVRWEGSVPHRVEGEVTPELLAEAHASQARHHDARALASRVLTRVMVGPRRHRPRPVRYDDVVKPELRRGDGALLEQRIYTPTR